MNEAINQLHEKLAPTPLAILNRSEDSQGRLSALRLTRLDTYEASKHLQGTGNTTAQPMVNHAVTPNLYKMNSMQVLGLLIPSPHGDTWLQSGSLHSYGYSLLGLSLCPWRHPREWSTYLSFLPCDTIEELHDLFQALPKSQYDRSSYDVSLEELNELEETHMKKEEEGMFLSTFVTSSGGPDGAGTRHQETGAGAVPIWIRSSQWGTEARPACCSPSQDLQEQFEYRSLPSVDELANEIDRLLRLEMYDLLKYDIYKWVYPEKAKGPVTKEMLSEEQILAGTAMIDEETQLMDHSCMPPRPFWRCLALTEEDVTRYYQMKKAKYLYNPTTKSFCYIDDLSAVCSVLCCDE